MTAKRLLLTLLFSLLLVSNAYPATPTRQYPNTTGSVIDATKVTANEDVIYLYLQAGVEAYKDGTIIGDDLSTSIAITSSGNMTFSGTTNISTLQLGGVAITSSAAEINKTDGLNSTAAELNILNGATLSTIELNYVDGVTSAIQTQLDSKSATTGNASIATVGTITTGTWTGTAIAVANGGTGATSAANARTNLGLGSISTQASNSVSISGGAITGITDLAIADGGTGSSSTTYCNLTTNVTGVLPVANGGTGSSSGSFARIKTGTYTGNGATSQAITGVGFQPKVIYLFAKSVVAGHYVKTDQDTGAYAHYQDSAFTGFQDDLITIGADGFTVGDGTGGSGENPNTNTAIYDYICH